MKNILIAGGTGLVGKRLTEILVDKGYTVTILTRTSGVASNNPNISFANWDTDQQTIDEQAIFNADAIINLAGASVAEKRWSAKRKKKL